MSASDPNALKVRVMAPGNVSIATPGATIDGVTMVVGDEFLAPAQSTPSQDGLYVYQGASTPATRSLRLPTGSDAAGLLCVIEEGTSADEAVLCTNNTGAGTVGTHNLTFAVLSTASVKAKCFQFVEPDAAGVNIHDAIASDNATPISGPMAVITNPSIPRTVQVVFTALWDGGDITIVGTDQFDNAQTEVIADAAGTTVQGVKVWKTITSISNETIGAGAVLTATVQTGPSLGLLTAISGDAFGIAQTDGAADNAVFNAAYNSFKPAAAPNGSRTYVVCYNVSN